MKNWIDIFLAFLQLGLTSFGGPVAHLSYFHSEFVAKRDWIADDAYADLVALCQFLPGPASSQVGIAIGLSRGGITGSLAAWLGFTLPSAILMMMLGLGISKLQNQNGGDWLHGLKIAAVAVVAQALWSMQSKLCPDLKRIGIALGAAALTTLFPGSWSQVLALVGGAIVGYFALPALASTEVPSRLTSVSRKIGALSLSIFAFLLVILPLWAHWNSDVEIQLMDRFFRTGALVFGGGHAALPLLESAVVLPGWISKDFFMAGYGAAQAIPGPLFTFTAFLGAVISGWMGATLCLAFGFLPSFLLVIGALPFWDRIRTTAPAKSLMRGTNAAVVGILFTAFINPVWSTSILNYRDFGIALAAFVLLTRFRIPSWAAVLICGIAGGVLL